MIIFILGFYYFCIKYLEDSFFIYIFELKGKNIMDI